MIAILGLACIVGLAGGLVAWIVAGWLLRPRVGHPRSPPLATLVVELLSSIYDFFDCGESPPDNYLIGLQKMAMQRFRREAKEHGIVGIKRTRLYCQYRLNGCSQFEALMRVD